MAFNTFREKIVSVMFIIEKITHVIWEVNFSFHVMRVIVRKVIVFKNYIKSLYN